MYFFRSSIEGLVLSTTNGCLAFFSLPNYKIIFSFLILSIFYILIIAITYPTAINIKTIIAIIRLILSTISLGSISPLNCHLRPAKKLFLGFITQKTNANIKGKRIIKKTKPKIIFNYNIPF